MNKLIIVVLSALLFLQYNINQLPAPAKPSPVKHLQEVSVTVKYGTAQGSGVIQKFGNDVYVWTCNHVLTTKMEDPHLEVIQYKYHNGTATSMLYTKAIVFATSEAYDLAILKIEHNDIFKIGARIYTENNVPPLGETIWSIGSPYGEANHNSTFKGIYSQYDRWVKTKKVDQIHSAFAPGVSGGGVFLDDGRLVGLNVMMRDPNIGFIIPARTMIKWAKTTKYPKELLR